MIWGSTFRGRDSRQKGVIHPKNTLPEVTKMLLNIIQGVLNYWAAHWIIVILFLEFKSVWIFSYLVPPTESIDHTGVWAVEECLGFGHSSYVIFGMYDTCVFCEYNISSGATPTLFCSHAMIADVMNWSRNGWAPLNAWSWIIDLPHMMGYVLYPLLQTSVRGTFNFEHIVKYKIRAPCE